MRMRLLKNPMPRNLTILLIWLAAAPAAVAQDAYFSIRPGLISADEMTLGARWELGVEPTMSTALDLSFPREWWFSARGRGAATAAASQNPEPLLDAAAEAGLQILLMRQRPCLPGDCPEDLLDFDYGYVVAGIRTHSELDQRLTEGVLGGGAFATYRPLGLQHDFWPFVPTISAGVSLVHPVISELRDSLDVELSPHGRLDLDLIWHVSFARSWLPSWVRPGRFDASIQHFREWGKNSEIDAAQEEAGTFGALDLGYELTGIAPWFRHAFVRWSTGTQPVERSDRQAWMIGLVIGEPRP